MQTSTLLLCPPPPPPTLLLPPSSSHPPPPTLLLPPSSSHPPLPTLLLSSHSFSSFPAGLRKNKQTTTLPTKPADHDEPVTPEEIVVLTTLPPLLALSPFPSYAGLRKNDHLAENILTPTTKAADHDEPVTPEEIVSRGLMTREELLSVCPSLPPTPPSPALLPSCAGLRKNDRLAANILTPTTKAADHDKPVTPEEIVSHGLMTRGKFETTRGVLLKPILEALQEYKFHSSPSVHVPLPHTHPGLRKNDRLAANILTPTTKAVDHDEPVTPEEIASRGLMTREEFETTRDLALKLFAFGQQVAGEHGLMTCEEFGTARDLALKLFAFGQQVAGEHGLILVDTKYDSHRKQQVAGQHRLILVDTKYEFGKDSDGNIRLIDEQVAGEHGLFLVDTKYEFGKDSDGSIRLIDEVHTPDSSRYWIAPTYEQSRGAAIQPSFPPCLSFSFPCSSPSNSLATQVHTPDSSRYWIASTYEQRHEEGLEPQNIDKVRICGQGDRCLL
ncbi:unnamed protein product [Closterium sp. Naga37s-1]|nr:unnamed protein product [Closterium sp. Naga37s-1]